MTDFRFVDLFRAVDEPNKPFCILPVGHFSRFGRSVDITREKLTDMMSHFGHIPETAIPVTLEHTSYAGKVGDIARLELREDGLYAVINWLSRGLEALREEMFSYFSPEVLWGPTDYDGQVVSNLLVGLSLVNQPFFGNATAIYSMEDKRMDYPDKYKDFSQEKRDELAKSGQAMPDGSYPIENTSDLKNAIQAVGRAKNPSGVKAHIKKRAKALGATDQLPEEWKGEAMPGEGEGDQQDKGGGAANEQPEEFEDTGHEPAQSDEEQDKAMAQNILERVKQMIDDAIAAYAKKDEAQDKEMMKGSLMEDTTNKPTNDELTSLKAQVAALEQEKKDRELNNRVMKFSLALDADKYKLFADIPALLAQVPDEAVANKLLEQYKALAAQVDQAKLFGESGVSSGANETAGPAEKFMAAVQVKMDSGKVTEADAMSLVAKEHPDLYYAYRDAMIAGATK